VKGNVVARFVYGTQANVPDAMIKGGKVYRILTDHLGSPRLVVDSATGTVVQRMDGGALGRVTGDTNPEWQPFGFAGGLMALMALGAWSRGVPGPDQSMEGAPKHEQRLPRCRYLTLTRSVAQSRAAPPAPTATSCT